MARTLVLVRHAKPVSGGAGLVDAERTLTVEGRQAVQASFPKTFSLLDKTKRIVLWASPAVRAWQTAEVVAASLGIDESDIEEHTSIYAQDEIMFLEEVVAADADIVIAVGHIPMVENLTTDLSAIALDFMPGAAAALELIRPLEELVPAKLLWFVQGPRVEA